VDPGVAPWNAELASTDCLDVRKVEFLVVVQVGMDHFMKVFDKPMKKIEQAEQAETTRKILLMLKGKHSGGLSQDLYEHIFAQVRNGVPLLEAAGNGRDI
jgi:hypothetical protein